MTPGLALLHHSQNPEPPEPSPGSWYHSPAPSPPHPCKSLPEIPKAGLRLSTLEITFTPNLSAHHSGSAVALLLIVPSSEQAGMGNRPWLIHDSRLWNALLPSTLQRPSLLSLSLSYLPKSNFGGETEVWVLCFTRRWEHMGKELSKVVLVVLNIAVQEYIGHIYINFWLKRGERDLVFSKKTRCLDPQGKLSMKEHSASEFKPLHIISLNICWPWNFR